MTNGQPQQVNTSSFWSRHSRLLARLIIIAIIIVAAVIYSQSQSPVDTEVAQDNLEQTEEGVELGLPIEESEVAGEDIEVTDDSQDDAPELIVTEKEDVEQEVKISGDQISVSAGRGDGYTHLARRALVEYLSQTGSQELQAEHKIYVEDYLQKNVQDKQLLHPGDEVSFSQGDIQDAIDAALALTENQVENLSQYVQMVPSLN